MRLLIETGALIAGDLPPREAAIAAIIGPLTDDPMLSKGLLMVVDAYL